MKKVLALTIGILIASVSFSQIGINVTEDFVIEQGDTLDVTSDFKEVEIIYTGKGTVKINFIDRDAGTYLTNKLKVVGKDSDNPDAFILESEELGRVRLTHDVIKFKGKIEIKNQNRVIVLDDKIG